MKQLFHLLPLIVFPILLSAEDCRQDKEILKVLLSNPYIEGENNIVTVNYIINEWEFQKQRQKLKTDGTVVAKLENLSLGFSNLNACHKILHLSEIIVYQTYYQNYSAYPESDHFASINPLGIHHHSTLTVALNENGSLIVSRRYDTFFPCETDLGKFPFGNTTCKLVFGISQDNKPKTNVIWEPITMETARYAGTPSNAGSLFFRDVITSVSANEELKFEFIFSQSSQEILIHFFIPSILFLLPPLLTLLLGPMAITRCCILMTSLILLSIHYHTAVPSLPRSEGVDAISIWKLFSYLFVISIVIELVIITLLASVGRSRTCCISRHKSGKYEMEPLYEELNDLRQRRTRKTRNCCRVSALIFDFVSFVVFGFVLVIFCYGYYTNRNVFVNMINDFEMESLHIF